MSETSLENLCRELLHNIGEDISRPGLTQTPDRFARMIREITSGYSQNIDGVLNNAVFEDASSQMVVVKNIEFYSLCEHHLLPFFGRVHVAYLPNGKIIGLSKIPRIVEMYARRLQVQERMSSQIANAIQEILNPLGVACMVEGKHLCAMMRGVEVQSSSMVTSVMLGDFGSNPSTRSEFLSIVRD